MQCPPYENDVCQTVWCSAVYKLYSGGLDWTRAAFKWMLINDNPTHHNSRLETKIQMLHRTTKTAPQFPKHAGCITMGETESSAGPYLIAIINVPLSKETKGP